MTPLLETGGNHNLPIVMLLGGLSVNLNHLKQYGINMLRFNG